MATLHTICNFLLIYFTELDYVEQRQVHRLNSVFKKPDLCPAVPVPWGFKKPLGTSHRVKQLSSIHSQIKSHKKKHLVIEFIV